MKGDAVTETPAAACAPLSVRPLFERILPHQGFSVKLYGILNVVREMPEGRPPKVNSHILSVAEAVINNGFRRFKEFNHHSVGFAAVEEGPNDVIVTLAIWTRDDRLRQMSWTVDADVDVKSLQHANSPTCLVGTMASLPLLCFETRAWAESLTETMEANAKSGLPTNGIDERRAEIYLARKLLDDL
jgi:hypothetical protein